MKRVSSMLAIYILFTCAVLVAGGSAESESSSTAPQGAVVVGKTMAFSWNITADDRVEFTITAASTGWVSIGFNPTSRMKDASYVIGYVANGTAVLRDDFGTGTTTHAADTTLGGTNNVRLISGKEEDGRTTLVFSIPLDSKDPYDTVLVRGAKVKVVMARGADNADNFTSGHRESHSAEIVLQ